MIMVIVFDGVTRVLGRHRGERSTKESPPPGIIVSVKRDDVTAEGDARSVSQKSRITRIRISPSSREIDTSRAECSVNFVINCSRQIDFRRLPANLELLKATPLGRGCTARDYVTTKLFK